ncbi:MAG: KTSC domain-containing protein [Alphaproteobacteria bacterium]|nr:KTSC domain-containing protein [Alphaproteobacteria bacterium]MBV9418293.1 KTSC domain-containing protein [Alphaproteobacteria bacterium]MBV9541090.1 KTSC domain-containing protein [Alphaproteobacteria bacterium]
MQSSSIEAAGYDLERRTLRIRFVGGSTYDYHGVPAMVLKQLLAAESKGRFVNWSIKPYYRYTRLRTER